MKHGMNGHLILTGRFSSKIAIYNFIIHNLCSLDNYINSVTYLLS